MSDNVLTLLNNFICSLHICFFILIDARAVADLGSIARRGEKNFKGAPTCFCCRRRISSTVAWTRGFRVLNPLHWLETENIIRILVCTFGLVLMTQLYHM